MLKTNQEKCEICGKYIDHWEKHHIQSKCYGGSNKPYNKCCLCSKCHKMVHCGLVILEGKFGSLNGTKLVYHKFYEDSVTNLEPPKVWLQNNYKKIQENYLKNKF